MVEEGTLETLGRVIANVDVVDADEKSEEDILDTQVDAEEVCSMAEQLRGLAEVRGVLERLGNLTPELNRGIIRSQRELRVEKAASMRQASIRDHFGVV